MTASDMLINLIQEYFTDMGYDRETVMDFFNRKNFKELVSIRLANANVMIQNKTDRSSHQTHIAITGEAIGFFYGENEFQNLDNKRIDKVSIKLSKENIGALLNKQNKIEDNKIIEIADGYATIGKRTQKQVQLSKRNSENSENFNSLRRGLYEDDLLILLKYRNENSVFVLGIPKSYYLKLIPNYESKFETNTYLRISVGQNNG